MRTVAIIQARMGSSRLPEKTLSDICGKPMLFHIIERIKTCKSIDEIVVATTTLDIDTKIENFVTQYGIKVYRGSPNDVLDRYYQVSKKEKADIIIRITADDPLKDPNIIDKILNYFNSSSNLDYASNTIEPTYPEGLDVDIFTFRTLERIWINSRKPSDREHVVTYIWNNLHHFNVINVKNDENLSHMRWTVDYETDLQFVREIYKKLYRKGQMFYMDDILKLIQDFPEIEKINDGVAKRNEGYLKSLIKD